MERFRDIEEETEGVVGCEVFGSFLGHCINGEIEKKYLIGSEIGNIR